MNGVSREMISKWSIAIPSVDAAKKITDTENVLMSTGKGSLHQAKSQSLQRPL